VKLKMRVRNESQHRRPFVMVGYNRAMFNGPKHWLEEVCRIENEGGDPGEELSFDVEWSTLDYPPSRLIWKAPPEHSLVWEILEFTFDGKPMMVHPGRLA